MQQDFVEQIRSLPTEELLARIARYDDWQPEYIEIVKSELKARNKATDIETLVSEREKALQLEELKECPIPKAYFVLSYLILLPVILSPVNLPELLAGKVIAVAILLFIVVLFQRKKDVSGHGKVYKYRKADRLHLVYIMALAVVSMFLRLALTT